MTPDFINGDFKWHIDKKYQKYLTTEQAENLPKLTNLGVFRVVNEKEGIDDYVLIDNKQTPINYYSYSPQGAEQLEAFINMLKISKHYNDYEKRPKRKYTKD
jgi:hypothetical protein